MSATYPSTIGRLAAQSERGLMLAETVGHYLAGSVDREALEGELTEYLVRMAVLQAEDGPQ
jgi:hypothetical protein